MKNPRLAAPVLAGRTLALGNKPKLTLVACVFLALTVTVTRVQATEAPQPQMLQQVSFPVT